MFDKSEMVSESGFVNTSYKSFGRFARLRSMLKIGLVALLVQSPIYATDPIEVDPDPDITTTIVVEDSAEVNPESLPPGRYMIIVVDEDGSREAYEIQKH